MCRVCCCAQSNAKGSIGWKTKFVKCNKNEARIGALTPCPAD
jgi:hypothetical protein